MPRSGASGAASIEPDEQGGNKATGRVLGILAAFLEDDSPLGVSELSRRLDMTKSMVHRGVSTLARHDYLVRDESGRRYQLGFAVANFGTLYLRPPDIHRLCRPAMERLAELTGESVSLHIPVGPAVVCIDGVEGAGPVARRVPLGHSIPLHASPASRAVLAYLPGDEVEHYLRGPLEIFTDRTLHTPEQVHAEIERVRRDGFARGIGDHVPANLAAGAAFPVRDIDDEPHGSITVAGPIDRFPQSRCDELIEPMLAIIAELERASRLYPSSREPLMNGNQDG